MMHTAVEETSLSQRDVATTDDRTAFRCGGVELQPMLREPRSGLRAGSVGERLLRLAAELEDRTPTAKTQRENRRALPRRESVSVVSVHRIGTEEPVRRGWMDWLLHSARLQGQLCDISMSSVAFLLSESAQVGERMMLRLSNPCVSERVDTIGTVIRAGVPTDGITKIVCRLEKRLTFAEV
ncbi:MAG: hypothetical protein IID45_11390, partial [Planctomycetes bacterium]|nr:hypothetical protein [Planctomycetota bacterium]